MAENSESILLDTSVWVDALQGRTTKIVNKTQALLNEDRVLTCGPVLFEIKRGIRGAERKKVLPLFEALVRLSFDDTLWDLAGYLDASLRKKGITVPPMDILIAQICLYHKVSLFTLDEHFHSVPGLKLFRP